MKKTNKALLENWHDLNHQNKISGRRIAPKDIEPLINSLDPIFKVHKIGESFLKHDIHKVSFGSGENKILIWTQMHGNESTGTKALFDLFSFFTNKHSLSDVANHILKTCTVVCIPMLNPDGAIAYTRVNAQDIDLNRDVIDKKAPESNILQQVLQEEEPQYCFNMHDQRTIFSVGKENNPATLSFLAPSVNKERSITEGRKKTMEVIVSMNQLLQNFIPKQIGRYTDEFYPTATGDNFQKMGYNTILIESGHYKNDYSREISRKYTFFALLQGLIHIAGDPKKINYKDYFDIPNNEKRYLDIILTETTVNEKKTDIGILYKERFINGQLLFVPEVEITGDLSTYNANKRVSGKNLNFSDRGKVNKWLKNEFN